MLSFQFSFVEHEECEIFVSHRVDLLHACVYGH